MLPLLKRIARFHCYRSKHLGPRNAERMNQFPTGRLLMSFAETQVALFHFGNCCRSSAMSASRPLRYFHAPQYTHSLRRLQWILINFHFKIIVFPRTKRRRLIFSSYRWCQSICGAFSSQLLPSHNGILIGNAWCLFLVGHGTKANLLSNLMLIKLCWFSLYRSVGT